MKKVIVIALVLVFMGSISTVFAQKDKEQVVSSEELISGAVLTVDVDNSAFVIKKIKDAESNTYEVVDINITPETKIVKGEVSLELFDIKAGDNVTVQYGKNEENNTIVEKVTVK